MNLICFPTFCAGAIICDLLNNEKSGDEKFGGISNLNSSRLKIPYNKQNTVLWYRAFFEKKIKQLNLNESIWVGTHCWPTEIDTSRFNKVLLISTENRMSKIYRLMRVYFLFEGLHKKYNFSNDKFENIDEKLKTINLDEFKFDFNKTYNDNITNIEFEEIVEWNNNFVNFIEKNSVDYSIHHLYERKEYWQKNNNFLYDKFIIEKFINRYNNYEKMQGN